MVLFLQKIISEQKLIGMKEMLCFSLKDYIRSPNHYSFESFRFYSCANFQDYVKDYLEEDYNNFVEKYNIKEPLAFEEYLMDISAFPIIYMVIHIAPLLDSNFPSGANFIAALVEVFDIANQEKRELAGEAFFEDALLIIRFRNFPRDVSKFPLLDTAISDLSNAFNGLNKEMRDEITCAWFSFP